MGASSEKEKQQNTFSFDAYMGHWNRWATMILYSSPELTSSCLVRAFASHFGLCLQIPLLYASSKMCI